MSKNIFNLLGIAVLVIIVIVSTLFYFNLIPGKTGDTIITLSGVIIAIILFIISRKKKMKSK